MVVVLFVNNSAVKQQDCFIMVYQQSTNNNKMIDLFTKVLQEQNYDFHKEMVIFDIGSRDCMQSIEFYKKFPQSKIYAFECNPTTLPLCRKNIEPYSSRITLIDKAVHQYDGKCIFHPINTEKTITTWKDGNPGASSLFQSNGSYPIETYIQDTVELDCTRLDSAIQQYNIPSKIDLIWMDLQGAELLALESMGEYLQTVDYIYTEVSYREIYTEQVLFKDLHGFLLKNGFINITPFHPSRDLWQEDVIYKKQ